MFSGDNPFSNNREFSVLFRVMIVGLRRVPSAETHATSVQRLVERSTPIATLPSCGACSCGTNTLMCLRAAKRSAPISSTSKTREGWTPFTASGSHRVYYSRSLSMSGTARSFSVGIPQTQAYPWVVVYSHTFLRETKMLWLSARYSIRTPMVTDR